MRGRYYLLLCLGMILLLSSACSQKVTETSPKETVKASTTEAFTLKFASETKGKELLLTEDDYTDAWSQFDIDSKSNKAGNTKAAYFEHISAQVLEWTEEEQTMLLASAAKIKQSFADQNFKLQLAEPVYLVKTTSKEEGGAVGYTRGNYIVLSETVGTMKPEDFDYLLAHELFHVISRSKSNLRKQLYALIGFKMMNEVSYPEVMRDYRITNPDATQNDSYINLTVGEETVPCMMILYSNRPYDGGSFFNYLNVGFLKLEGDTTMEPVTDDEGPVIYTMAEVANFYEQVGRNTQYIIHPEEIMADNFTYAVLGKEGLSNPELVEKIKGVLKQ